MLDVEFWIREQIKDDERLIKQVLYVGLSQDTDIRA
jgi:hypothetical protein